MTDQYGCQVHINILKYLNEWHRFYFLQISIAVICFISNVLLLSNIRGIFCKISVSIDDVRGLKSMLNLGREGDMTSLHTNDFYQTLLN